MHIVTNKFESETLEKSLKGVFGCLADTHMTLNLWLYEGHGITTTPMNLYVFGYN